MSTSILAGLRSEVHDYYRKIPKVIHTHTHQLHDTNDVEDCM